MARRKKVVAIQDEYKPKAIEMSCRGFGEDGVGCERRGECLRYEAFVVDREKAKKRMELIYCVSLLSSVDCPFFVGELSGG